MDLRPGGADSVLMRATCRNEANRGGNEHDIVYTAPAQEEFDDIIIAESTSNTGARATSSEPRLDIADATSKEQILVDPFATCVEPDSARQFTAEVLGETDSAVTWAVIDGEGGIDPGTGLYTAPGEAGTARVQATSVANPSLQAEAGVSIGGCNCWWSVQVAATAYGRPGLSTVSGGYSYVGREILSILASGNDAGAFTEVGGFGLGPGSESRETLAGFGSGTWDAVGIGSISTRILR